MSSADAPASSSLNPIEHVFGRIDAYQRSNTALGFVHGVLKRYGEDRGGWLGAAISYYGFFSLVPALLAFVTIVYWVLGSKPRLLAGVLAALWATLPLVEGDTRRQIHPISGNPPVLVISLLISMWAALGVVRVLEDASNVMWCVPAYRRPGFFPKLARAGTVLGIAAAALCLTGSLTVLTFAGTLPALALAVIGAVNVAIDVVLFAALSRALTARRLAWRDVWPGALIAGISLYVLTLLGGVYVNRSIARASAIYGSFAAVIGLLAWVSLLVQAFVFANLVNVVRHERLWPRTMTGRDLTEADVRAIQLTMQREALVSESRLSGPAAPLNGRTGDSTQARLAGDHPDEVSPLPGPGATMAQSRAERGPAPNAPGATGRASPPSQLEGA